MDTTAKTKAYQAADRALATAAQSTVTARRATLPYPLPNTNTESYENHRRAVAYIADLWAGADRAWNEYDAALARLREVTGLPNEELWSGNDMETAVHKLGVEGPVEEGYYIPGHEPWPWLDDRG